MGEFGPSQSDFEQNESRDHSRRKFIKNTAIKKEFIFIYLLILFFLFIHSVWAIDSEIVVLKDAENIRTLNSNNVLFRKM